MFWTFHHRLLLRGSLAANLCAQRGVALATGPRLEADACWPYGGPWQAVPNWAIVKPTSMMLMSPSGGPAFQMLGPIGAERSALT